MTVKMILKIMMILMKTMPRRQVLVIDDQECE